MYIYSVKGATWENRAKLQLFFHICKRARFFIKEKRVITFRHHSRAPSRT